MNYYLALDVGTHASRAILYNEQGKMISGQVKPVRLIRHANGHIEQDPQELLNAVFSAVDNLLEFIDSDIRRKIKACGIATQRSSIIAFNRQGQPLSPVISWQDVRGAAYLKSIELTSDEVWDLSGLPLSAHYSASKCRWLLEHDARVKNTTADQLTIAPLGSFLLFHLTGIKTPVIDHSNAQRMQLLDLSSLDWSDKLTEAFGIPKKILPACKPMCDHYGELLDTAIPIDAMCGDQNAAIFGNGELDEQTAIINLGSGAFIMRMLCSLLKTPRLLTSIACSTPKETHFLQEGTVNGAGNAISWFLEKHPLDDWQTQLPVWFNEIKNPPLFINAVGHLGSPWWSNRIKAEFLGGDDITERFLAIIESIVFLLQNNLDLFNAEKPVKLIKVSGGLSQSDDICQKIANLSQLPVQQTSDTEATSRGTAWMASGSRRSWPETAPGCYFKPQHDPGLEKRYEEFTRRLKEMLKTATVTP